VTATPSSTTPAQTTTPAQATNLAATNLAATNLAATNLAATNLAATNLAATAPTTQRCDPPTPECLGGAAIAATTGRRPGQPPTAPLAVALWDLLALVMAGICVGALAWSVRRAPRSRLRSYLTMEATT